MRRRAWCRYGNIGDVTATKPDQNPPLGTKVFDWIRCSLPRCNDDDKGGCARCSRRTDGSVFLKLCSYA